MVFMCAGRGSEKPESLRKRASQQGLKKQGKGRIEINSSIVPAIKRPIHRMTADGGSGAYACRSVRLSMVETVQTRRIGVTTK
jgi:hypothetical protein